MMRNGTLLKDETGNASSKRVFGAIGMGFFFLLSGGIALYTVFKGNDIGSEAASLVKTIGMVSGSLLGIGVVEKLGGKK